MDLPATDRVTAKELARRLMDRLRPHAEDLGSAAEFDGVEDILDNGTGAARQVRRLRGQPRSARGGARDRGRRACPRRPRPLATRPIRAGTLESTCQQPDLFVVCKNCGSEVSPYVTECPYCGQRVRKRAPKLDRSGRRAPAASASAAARAAAPAPEEIAGIAPDTRPVRDLRADLRVVACWSSLVAAPGRRAPSTSAASRRARSTTSRGGSSPPRSVHDSLGYAVRRARRRRASSARCWSAASARAGGASCSCCRARPAWRWSSLSRRRRCSRPSRSSRVRRQRRRARPARAPGWWTTAWPRAAATSATTTCWAST